MTIAAAAAASFEWSYSPERRSEIQHVLTQPNLLPAVLFFIGVISSASISCVPCVNPVAETR